MDWSATASLHYFYLIIIGLVYGNLLYLLACDLAACFRRWSSRAAAQRLLDSVPDVPYFPLPDEQAAAGGGGGPLWSSPSCVICMAEYERGEGRFVMPVCGHAFHRGCIAEWLRQGKATCPICRATAVVVAGLRMPPVAGDEDVFAVGVSTAEDMV